MKTLLRNYWVVITLYLCFSLLYSVMAIIRHNAYLTLEDLAVYHQIFWQLAHLKWPWSSFYWLDRPFLTDHFQPIFLFITPFFWLHSGAETLLIIQPFLTLLAIFPLYAISLRLTHSYWLTFGIILTFAFYVPLQHMLLFDFHEMTFVPPLMAIMYYAFLAKRPHIVNISLLLLLLVKEDMGFLIATVGMWLLFFQRGWRRLGVVWMMLGFTYSLVIVYLVMPMFGNNYIHDNWSISGQTGINVLAHAITNPAQYVSLYFDDPVKRDTLFRSFVPYLFLPLLSPFSLLLSLEQFAGRFWFESQQAYWTIRYHYSAPIAIIVSIGTVSVLGALTKYRISSLIQKAIAVSFISLTAWQTLNESPIKYFFESRPWEYNNKINSINKAINIIPPEASVQTQNVILSHVSGRDRVDYYKSSWDADYILLDLDMENPAWSLVNINTFPQLLTEIKEATSSNKYTQIFQSVGTHYRIALFHKSEQ